VAGNSIGLIELSSIASGFAVTDTMLKASDVALVVARSICSGKYMVMVRGDTAAVESAVEAGTRTGAFSIVDSFVIPNVHDDLFPALSGTSGAGPMEALGVLEAFSVASLIEGADAMAKTANVRLVEVRLAMALGGKAFATVTGSVAAVSSAVEAGARSVGKKGLLVNKVVIPSPRPELLREMI
jgi:microcompartment protein CcmL/EutN